MCSMVKSISEISMVNFADLLHGKNNYQDSHGEFRGLAPWENSFSRFAWLIIEILSMEKVIIEIPMVNFAD